MRNFEEFEQDMRNAFKALDAENNGKIQEHELRHILRNLGESRVPGEEVDILLSETRVDVAGGVVRRLHVPFLNTHTHACARESAFFLCVKQHTKAPKKTFLFAFVFADRVLQNYDDFVDQLVTGYPPEAGL